MNSPKTAIVDFFSDAFDGLNGRFNAMKDSNCNSEFHLIESLTMSDNYGSVVEEADYGEALEEKDADGQLAQSQFHVIEDEPLSVEEAPRHEESPEPERESMHMYIPPISPVKQRSPVEEYNSGKENDGFKNPRGKVSFVPADEPKSPEPSENDSDRVIPKKTVQSLIARFNTGEAFKGNTTVSNDYKKAYGVGESSGSVNKGIFQ